MLAHIGYEPSPKTLPTGAGFRVTIPPLRSPILSSTCTFAYAPVYPEAQASRRHLAPSVGFRHIQQTFRSSFPLETPGCAVNQMEGVYPKSTSGDGPTLPLFLGIFSVSMLP